MTEAMEVMKNGKPKVLEYGVTNELAWEVSLACGGSIRLRRESRMKQDAETATGRPGREKDVALATDIDSGEQTLIYRDAASGLTLSAEILSITRQSIQDDRNKIYDVGGRRIFVEVFNPPLRMLIVGAYIAQPLSRRPSPVTTLR